MVNKNTEEMKKLLEKLNKIENRSIIFESLKRGDAETKKHIKETVNLIYKKAEKIAEFLSEQINVDKDDLKFLIREMAVSYEKTFENVVPLNKRSLQNPEVQKKIKDAIINFMTLRDWNPRHNPEEQAEWAAEDHGIDKEFFKRLLRNKGLL